MIPYVFICTLASDPNILSYFVVKVIFGGAHKAKFIGAYSFALEFFGSSHGANMCEAFIAESFA